MMSHELRTPLTAIQGYLELLEMGIYGGMTEEQISILRRIESNERHLLAIINDLLDFARVDAKRVELRITPLQVRDIRLAVDPVCRPQIDSKQLNYSWQGPGDQLIVRADREKVRQIVVNLVSNACKFTPRGGGIDVECVCLDRFVELRVTDTGPGIPTQKLDAIFEPFVQLDNGLTRATAGTGLGLAISRELARAMGGDLAATSSLGQGSTFTLTLPRGDVEAELLPEPTASSYRSGARDKQRTTLVARSWLVAGSHGLGKAKPPGVVYQQPVPASNPRELLLTTERPGRRKRRAWIRHWRCLTSRRARSRRERPRAPSLIASRSA
jgi:hypothetical protein